MKISWCAAEVVAKGPGKIEKLTKIKNKLTKVDRGSVSGTSIESKASGGTTFVEEVHAGG